MSNAARGAERRPVLIAAGLLTAGFLVLWLLLPDKIFTFDGVMFTGVIERTTTEWREMLFNPRHFLFNPAIQLLRDGLAACGVSVGGYRLVQIVNAFAGAAGLWLFGSLLRSLMEDDAFALLGAALLGATWTYGTRATEGQVYMLLGLGGIWTLWAAARLLEAPSTARAVHLALAFALATLFHAAAAFLGPAVLAALWLAFPARRGRLLAALALGAALVLIPYGLAFRTEGLRGFLSGATDYRLADSRGWWTGLFLRFWGGTSPARRLLQLWLETGRGILVMPEKPAAAPGLVLWLTVAGALAGSWKALDVRRRELASVLALAWAGCAFLSAFWPGGLFFTLLPVACLFGLLALAAGPRLRTLGAAPRRKLIGALGAAALALGAWNARAGLRPQSRIENNAAYDQALFIKAHTVPTSYIVIAGVVNSNLKIYIPNFAGRAREVLEYYFLSHPKKEALALFSTFLARASHFGVPLYVLGEILDDPRVHERMSALWGVSPEEVRAAFGPGLLLGVARRPDLSLYLFVPEGRRAETFAGLSYSILTESDMGRLNESVAAIKTISAAMSPAERRRAAAILRATDYGFNLMRDAFTPQMNPEERAGVELRRARFAERRKEADFWLRAGNLFNILGLKAETMEAWMRAQKISGNQELLRNLEALQKSK